jgi:hypothetical protein
VQCLSWVYAVLRRRSSVGANPTRQLSLRPEAIGAVMEVTKWLKPSDVGGESQMLARGRKQQRQSLLWVYHRISLGFRLFGGLPESVGGASGPKVWNHRVWNHRDGVSRRFSGMSGLSGWLPPVPDGSKLLA